MHGLLHSNSAPALSSRLQAVAAAAKAEDAGDAMKAKMKKIF